MRKRQKGASGWTSIVYGAHGEVVGTVDGFRRRPSLDVRIGRAHEAALREDFERGQAALLRDFNERPVWVTDTLVGPTKQLDVTITKVLMGLEDWT